LENFELFDDCGIDFGEIRLVGIIDDVDEIDFNRLPER
jgi:hypothetical protein